MLNIVVMTVTIAVGVCELMVEARQIGTMAIYFQEGRRPVAMIESKCAHHMIVQWLVASKKCLVICLEILLRYGTMESGASLFKIAINYEFLEN